MCIKPKKIKCFRIADLTEFGDIFDRDGYKDCDYNFAEVMKKIIDRKYHPRKCVLVLISCVGYMGNNPFRYSIERKYRCRTLFRKWEEAYGKPFTKYSYENIQEKRRWEFEAMEKQGERRAAWGLFRFLSRQQKAQNSSQDDIGCNLLYIG